MNDQYVSGAFTISWLARSGAWCAFRPNTLQTRVYTYLHEKNNHSNLYYDGRCNAGTRWSRKDASQNFAYGGWQAYLGDDVTKEAIGKFFTKPYELLLGRITYNIFASYWPNHPEIEDVATLFNSTKKYVVSHKQIELPWNNSQLVTGEVVAEIKKLKEMDGPDLFVWGSANLIQTLLTHSLLDQMHILTYPVTIGSGKKLFAEGTKPQVFKITDSIVSPTGVIIATYEPAGELKTGTIGE